MLITIIKTVLYWDNVKTVISPPDEMTVAIKY